MSPAPRSLLAALALVALLLAGTLSADLSFSDPTVLPSTVRPGTQGLVSLTVTNPDSHDALGVSAEGYGSSKVSAGGVVSLGDFRPDVSSKATLPFSVAPDTPAGLYSVTFRFTWTNETGARYKSIMVPITVTNPAILSAQSSGAPVYTSGDFDLDVMLANSGGAARAVRVSLDSSSFLQNGPNPLVVGDIGRGASKNFSLGIALAPSTASGIYSVPLSVVYQDESGQELTATPTLKLNVYRKSPQFSLQAQDGTESLKPGRQSALSLHLSNDGDEPAYDVRLRMSNSSALTPLGRSEIDIGTLGPRESRTVSLPVGVNDVSPGFYRQEFSLTHKDSKGEEQAARTVPLGLNIQAISDVSVFVSAKPSPIIAGDAHTLSVLVSNIGSAPIKALAVRMEPSSTFRLLDAQDQQYIGGLQADDFSTVQYKVQVADVADGEYPLKLRMTFKDAYNQERTVDSEVKLKVLTKATASNSTANGNGGLPLPLLLVGLAVIGGGAYFGYRRFIAKPAHKKA